jgi:hypothetical protein
MATIRNNVQDFMAAIRAQGKNANSTSPNLYSAILNADNFSVQVSVTKAGVTQVLYSKLVYNNTNPSVGPQGDGNIDSFTIFSADGAVGTGSVSNFLATLI